MTHPFGPMTCLRALWVSWSAQRTWSPCLFPSFHLISVIYCTAVNYVVGKHVSRFKDVCVCVCACSQDWLFLLRVELKLRLCESFICFFLHSIVMQTFVSVSRQISNWKVNLRKTEMSDDLRKKGLFKKKDCLHSIRASKSVCFRVVARECCVSGMKTLKVQRWECCDVIWNEFIVRVKRTLVIIHRRLSS